MLYITTRSDQTVYTSHCTLKEDKAADGGAYRVFHAPYFPKADIDTFLEKTFSQCVADILNVLFGTSLTSWDVEFAIGRYPVHTRSLGHRLCFAEPWHNPEWNYSWVTRKLAALLFPEADVITDWVTISVRIAVLFGVFGNLHRSGIQSADIVVVSGDLSSLISAWYARQWGLPINSILCCCDEESALWDLVCQGQIRTNSAEKFAGLKQSNLERLICECGGTEEVKRYLESFCTGSVYNPGASTQENLRNGLCISVTGKNRTEHIISRFYGTYGYIMSSHTAQADIGLMDYRAKTGKVCDAVILAEDSPHADAAFVAKALGISIKELMQRI